MQDRCRSERSWHRVVHNTGKRINKIWCPCFALLYNGKFGSGKKGCQQSILIASLKTSTPFPPSSALKTPATGGVVVAILAPNKLQGIYPIEARFV